MRIAGIARALAVGGALGAIAAWPAPTGAETLSGGDLRDRATGGEFRGDTATLRGFESHIWRFAPDGSVTAVATARRAPGNFGSMYDFGDAGRWRIEGDHLCIDWDGPNRQFSGCYSVEARQGNHVRLVGPARWEGTLER